MGIGSGCIEAMIGLDPSFTPIRMPFLSVDNCFITPCKFFRQHPTHDVRNNKSPYLLIKHSVMEIECCPSHSISLAVTKCLMDLQPSE